MWNVLKLEQLDNFTIAADMKMANLLCGISSHSSTHPCIYCDWSKSDPRGSVKSRTFEEIRTLSQEWKNQGQAPSRLKTFKNCQNFPIVKSKEYIMKIFPIPELHCLIGIVNRLYDNLLKVFPEAVK